MSPAEHETLMRLAREWDDRADALTDEDDQEISVLAKMGQAVSYLRAAQGLRLKLHEMLAGEGDAEPTKEEPDHD